MYVHPNYVIFIVYGNKSIHSTFYCGLGVIKQLLYYKHFTIN